MIPVLVRDGIGRRGSITRAFANAARGSRVASLVVPAIVNPESLAIRAASEDDADAIHDLVMEHLVEGNLLLRERDEIAAHAHRFVVAAHGSEVLACAELAPLSASVAEIRSLIVRDEARGLGVGRLIIDEIDRRAAAASFLTLSAFTHSPGYFVHFGFSIVPHAWLPEKIATDCHRCAHFRHCAQYAVVRPLERSRQHVPNAGLHG